MLIVVVVAYRLGASGVIGVTASLPGSGTALLGDAVAAGVEVADRVDDGPTNEDGVLGCDEAAFRSCDVEAPTTVDDVLLLLLPVVPAPPPPLAEILLHSVEDGVAAAVAATDIGDGCAAAASLRLRFALRDITMMMDDHAPTMPEFQMYVIRVLWRRNK